MKAVRIESQLVFSTWWEIKLGKSLQAKREVALRIQRDAIGEVVLQTKLAIIIASALRAGMVESI